MILMLKMTYENLNSVYESVYTTCFMQGHE